MLQPEFFFNNNQNFIHSREFHGRLQTPRVTRIIIAIISIECRMYQRLIIIAHDDRHIQMRVVAIVQAAPIVVPVEILGLSAELEVLVLELQAADAEHHALEHAVGACVVNG